MKTFPKYLLLPVLCLLLTGPIYARHSDTFTKEIRRSFQVSPDAKLVIDNKYGDVQCINWDQNAVRIVVKITVEAHDLDEANKLFDKMQVDISGSASLVEARTQLSQNLRMNGSFSIDYAVNLPATLSLDLTNKFGDIYADEIGGKAVINLGYGNAEINKLSNSDNLVDVRFGSAHIGSIKGAVMTLKYSNFDGDYAGSLRLNSQYSNFTANKVIALDATYEGGKIEITQSSALTCRSKFSDLRFGTVDSKIDLDISYGSFEAGQIPATFTSIQVSNSFGSVDLGMSADAAYSLEAEMHFCNLDYNEDKLNVSYRDVSSHDQTIRGTIGTNPTATVKLTSNYGNISLE